ncbi:MAG: hypothetical protein K2O40_06755 [Lachnospiraceae bacterium]|nr:hypothetical protein [Lachnospiraceae bacterium]
MEGQFVYGWDGTELVLLPVDSPDYSEIVNYTNIVQQGDLLKTKDLIIGASYLGKNNEIYIYMGKHPRYSWGYKYKDNSGSVVEVTNTKDIPEDLFRENKYIDIDNAYYGQYLWFAHRYEDSDYINNEFVPNGKFKYDFDMYKSIPKKIIKCITTERATDFDTIIEKMEHSSTYSPVDYRSTKAIRYEQEQFKQIIEQEFQNVRREGVFSDAGYLYTIEKNEDNTFNIGLSPKRSDGIISYKEPEEIYRFRRYKYNDGTAERANDFISKFKKYMGNVESRVEDITVENLTLEQLYEALKSSYIVEFLKNGKMHRIINNVLRIKEDEVMHGL